MSNKSQNKLGPVSIRDWLTTLPTVLVLLVVIFLGVGEAIHSRLLSFGEQTWKGYFKLRKDMPKPDCNPDVDIDKKVEQKVKEKKNEQDNSEGLGLIQSNPVDRDSVRESIVQKQENCRQKWDLYRSQQEKITTTVVIYRTIEKGVAFLKKISLNYTRHLLVFLILITAITATITRHHVVLRPQKTAMDHWVSTSLQFVANLILLSTVTAYWYTTYLRKDGVQYPWVHVLWIGGFALLSIISLVQLWKGVPDESWPRGSIYKTATTVPLYVYIVITGAIWFLFIEGYASGMTVQLRKMERFPSLFLKVGLYVWTGMLLKWSRLTKLVLDIIRPWKFPPEIVVIILVLLCAFPTAYSGASGIFVIAAGAVIYEELRKLGTRRQLSIATTAMSGSGVFLEPCLIVVIISALNKEVTTDKLFQYGFYVYLLMGVTVALLVLLTRRNEIKFQSPKNALKPCLKAFLPLIPYLLSGALVISGFYFVLNVPFDEYTAPDILPFMMLLIIFYDQWYYGRIEDEESVEQTTKEGQNQRTVGGYLNSVEHTIRRATSETTKHIGSLLMLMATTMILSGIVERSQVMTLVPSNFTSVWTAMLFLVVILLIIGMTMDPYGAVILVSATFAPVAYQNGIDPIHFWLVVLVAFELGYLTPPVALNQQFTRMVIGEKEYEEVAATESQYDSFWKNYEFILLPISVMAIVLMIVSFGPLLVQI